MYRVSTVFILILNLSISLIMSAAIQAEESKTLSRQIAENQIIAEKIHIAGGDANTRNKVIKNSERTDVCFFNDDICFVRNFEGANLRNIQAINEQHFVVTIAPENSPINNSPWYAFKVLAKENKNITIEFTYQDGSHRYTPKLSQDGILWHKANKEEFSYKQERQQALLSITASPNPLWISAQELYTYTQNTKYKMVE